MARSTMAGLIARTRTLIGDPTGQALADDDVQAALDLHRTERRFVPLQPQPTFLPDTTILYLDYYSDAQWWEDGVLLQDTSYATLTPTTSETLVGHWAFATQPGGIAVRATGKTYDVYAAAADLLEAWAAQVKMDFAFTYGRSQYQRDQKFRMMLDLARQYRGQALPASGTLAQNDATGWTGDTGNAVTYPDLRGPYGL